MKKVLFLVGLLAALSGCNSLVRKDGDWFEAAGHPVGQFLADDQACRAGAVDYITMGVAGSTASSYAANRAYNASYSHCMTAHRYRSRPYIKNWFE